MNHIVEKIYEKGINLRRNKEKNYPEISCDFKEIVMYFERRECSFEKGHFNIATKLNDASLFCMPACRHF